MARVYAAPSHWIRLYDPPSSARIDRAGDRGDQRVEQVHHLDGEDHEERDPPISVRRSAAVFSSTACIGVSPGG